MIAITVEEYTSSSKIEKKMIMSFLAPSYFSLFDAYNLLTKFPKYHEDCLKKPEFKTAKKEDFRKYISFVSMARLKAIEDIMAVHHTGKPCLEYFECFNQVFLVQDFEDITLEYRKKREEAYYAFLH